MGFTGQYVAGVWFGNDDYTPMARVTGGSLPAMAWKEFMTYAHATNNIPQIPGLPLHPNQIAEMERIASQKHEDPTLGAVATQSVRKMPPETLKVLETLGGRFAGAAALSDRPSRQTLAPSATTLMPAAEQRAAPNDRRSELRLAVPPAAAN